MKRLRFIAIAAIAAVVPTVGVASSASAYVLIGCKVPGGANITVYGSPPSGYSASFNAAVGDWSANTDVTMTSTTNPQNASIDITTGWASYGSTDWSGLTTLTCGSSGFWTVKPAIKINRTYLDGYTASQRNGVVAHELGHALGLDHNNGSPVVLMNYADPNRHNAGVYGTKADDRAGVNALY